MPPCCSICSKIASPSQSSRISFTFWTCPDSSPLCQSFLRERDQYTASPFCQVSRNASRFIHATISTRPLTTSCAMADTSPSSDQFTLFNQFSLIKNQNPPQSTQRPQRKPPTLRFNRFSLCSL